METPAPSTPQSPQSNPGFGPPPQQEVFDNKKATHKEVATFVHNVVTPMHKRLESFNAVLDALFLYFAEVGVMGVKITQQEIAKHYGKRVQEENDKRQAAVNAAQAVAVENTDVPGIAESVPPCTSEQNPDTSSISADSSDPSTVATTT